MEKIVLITGATSGIGRACALKFGANGFHVIATGRRPKRLHLLKEELDIRYGCACLPLCFDVRNRIEVEDAINSLDTEWKNISVLINNAGLALGLTPLHEGNTDDWETMIDTNIKGLLYMSRAVSRIMVQNGQGHIINIGSIAGKEVYPFGNVYCATKHAVNGLTKAMRIDLLTLGIKVSQVAPGAVMTEFSEVRFKGDRNRANRVYEGYHPLLAEDVADAVYYVAALPPHVNINDLLIMPFAQAGANFFDKKLQ
jgi:3-hydroxy acid dehydrogenase / malonic semialdehyde reductase